MSRARRRDRRVYLASHPVLLALLAVTRRAPVLRIGRTVLVNRAEEFHEALTRLPLDRLAAGTTGAVARDLVSDGLLFDQDGPDHRGARRSVNLGAAGVEQLRPAWQAVLDAASNRWPRRRGRPRRRRAGTGRGYGGRDARPGL